MRPLKIHFAVDWPFPSERYCRLTLPARHWTRIAQQVTCGACRQKMRRRRRAPRRERP